MAYTAAHHHRVTEKLYLDSNVKISSSYLLLLLLFYVKLHPCVFDCRVSHVDLSEIKEGNSFEH